MCKQQVCVAMLLNQRFKKRVTHGARVVLEVVRNRRGMMHEASLVVFLGEIPIVLDMAQREYEALYRARDMRCAPEIDGEILINESLLESPKSGFYHARISEVVGDDLLATLTRPL